MHWITSVLISVIAMAFWAWGTFAFIVLTH
jgi:hypothetical protein